MPFLFLLSILYASNPQADHEWRKLLHYEASIWGGYQSRASNQAFFTSSSRDPQSELESFLVKYDDSNINDEHVICKFPLRAKYVVKKGYKNKIADSNCERLQKFRQTLAPVGVSLIFSSYFLESPASTFGHTLLRIRRNLPEIASEEKIELLDHGIGYAANPTTSNPLLYTILGFTGGFDGIFSLVPYYYKVREYNDAESRDLWSYDLKMSKQEMDDLVDHLWEVGQATFPYYYLTENCSYYILEILEIVTGRKLLDRLPFWIIPVDTIKAVVEEPEFVTAVSFRPSLKSQFDFRVSDLSKKEIREVKTLKPTSTWTAKQIDTLIDYLEWAKPKEVRQEGSKYFLLRDQLLRQRAQFREPSTITVKTPDRPDAIHPSNRWGIHVGYHESKKEFLRLEQRFAYYDPIDPPKGKPQFSEIIFMDLQARIFDEDIDISKSDLVRAKIRNPITEWKMPLSYSMTLGGQRDSVLCEDCYVFRGHFDIGLSQPILNSHMLYLGAYNQLHASSHMQRGHAYYFGPDLEITSYWNKYFRSFLEVQYLDALDRDIDAFWAGSLELRYDLQPNKLSLSLKHTTMNTVGETRLGLYMYY